jgi:protein O-mannosyl-transferase
MSDREKRLGGWAIPAIALLAIAASITGIINGFTYDDRYIVELNPVMKSLAGWWRTFGASYWPKDWGGDGYRPLTILAFKIEYALGGGSPVAFHAANIALYGVACVLVYWLARRVFAPERWWAAWVAAALFAVHPTHVEAVAGVVGQSELLVGISLLSATLLYVRDRQRGALRPSTAAWIAALYAIGCFAKEHAIVLPGLLAAVELILLADREPMRQRIARLRPFYLVLVLVAVSFVAVRSWVLADHSIGGFQPFTPFNTLRISNTDRILTALGVVPEWVRLFYWPVRLSSEYGPPDVEIAQGFSVSQIPGLSLLVAIIALGFILRRREPVISFGIAWVIITLLPSSNFVLPAGIVLAERTLFLPSVGAMFVAAAIAAVVAERWKVAARPDIRLAARVAFAALLAAGAWRSATRSTVWRNNDRLFRQAVIDSPDAYRAHYMLGAWHFENQRKREGEAEYRRALSLFPYDPFLSYNMAEQYQRIGLCAPALPLYRWTFGLNANFPLGRGNFAWCLVNEGHYDEARSRAFETIRIGGDLEGMRRVIFITDSIRAAERGFLKSSPLAHLKPAGKVPETVQKAAAQAGVPRGE